MKTPIHDIIQKFQHGRIREYEALVQLHRLNVSGAFEKDDRFVGYDHERNLHIESAHGITVED